MPVKPALDKDPFIMYGKTPERNFFYDFPLSDSLKFLWTAEANGSFNHSSVSYYDQYVFVSDLSGRVFCYNILDGKKVGQLKTKGAIYSAPYVDLNQIIFVTALMDENKSILTYYSLNNNEVLHNVELTGRVLTEMLFNNGDIILCTETGRVYSFDRNGEKNWEVKTNSRIHSSPVMSGNIFYFGNDNGEIVAMNTATGDSVYRKKIGDTFQGGSSISGDYLYIGSDDGALYCIEHKSGTLKWEYKTESRIVMTPALDNENVYAGNLSGDFFALNKNSGKVIWNKKLGTLFNTAPLVASNYLLIPDLFKKLYFTDKETGEIKKSMEYDNRIKLTPVIFNKKIVIIGYDNGIIDAYEML